ncbi:MAG TPA: hypothetical protein VMY87_06120 [Armatimonadota bacterium]|nr:hypothetical protein [Armatimonadota bacterium]
MRNPRHYPGDPDAPRFRLQRGRSVRALRTAISSIAAPRALSSGAQRLQSSAGGGAGSSGGMGIQFIPSPSTIVNTGDPDTGCRFAICGLARCDSILDIAGA